MNTEFVSSKIIKVTPYLELLLRYNYEKAFGLELIMQHHDGGPLIGTHVIAQVEAHYNDSPRSEDQFFHWAVTILIPDVYSSFISKDDCLKILNVLKNERLVEEPVLLQTKRLCSYDEKKPGYLVQMGRIYEDDPDPYLEPVDK